MVWGEWQKVFHINPGTQSPLSYHPPQQSFEAFSQPKENSSIISGSSSGGRATFQKRRLEEGFTLHWVAFHHHRTTAQFAVYKTVWTEFRAIHSSFWLHIWNIFPTEVQLASFLLVFYLCNRFLLQDVYPSLFYKMYTLISIRVTNLHNKIASWKQLKPTKTHQLKN